MSLPSSPSRFSSRRSLTPSKTKKIDVGKPLGPYDTNIVRDRVRQWQAQGGGVVTAEDVGAEEDSATGNGYDKHAIGEDTPHTPIRSQNEAAQPSTSRSSRKSIRAEGQERERRRSRSAPTKRIVSDGHWKKKRSPPKSNNPSEAHGKTPIKTAIYEVNQPGALPDADIGGNTETIDGTSQKRTVSNDDDKVGLHTFATPTASQKRSNSRRLQGEAAIREMQRDYGMEASSKADLAVESGQGRQCRPLNQGQHQELKPSNGSERKRRSGALRSAYAHDSPQSIKRATSDGKGSINSHKSNVLSQVFGDSRKAPPKHTPEAVINPRVPSIEAWLNETPDPFTQPDQPPLEFIAPLKPSLQQKQREASSGRVEKVENPNNIWDTLDTKEGSRRVVSASRRRRRIPSSAITDENPFPADFDSDTGGMPSSDQSATPASKFVDLVRDSPSTSPSSLKRRSARKSVSSPIRNRPKSTADNEQFPEDAAISGLCSGPTISSVNGPDSSNPLVPPGLSIKRPFPSTGRHRLSTIASVETFGTRQGIPPISILEATAAPLVASPMQQCETVREAQENSDLKPPRRSNSRIAKHADLISVLSMPKASSRSIKSARSIRTNRSRLATATIEDLIGELTTDESKYMRELRTLVDGVIPVLLTCVLSKSDSAVAAGLFRPSASSHEDPNFTKPIVDMGIALERLKTLHKRIPQDNPTRFMTWAHGAQRVYAEYLRAWRMGFQDVVVNLAPAAENNATPSNTAIGNAEGLDEGLPRDENGDIVNGDGERVDVAFLLKRPLVRLKYLQKTLKGINFITPSAEAESLAEKYQNLVDDARRRSNEERARLEDEAASNIDASRTRDPRSLAPLAGANIDRTRRVRARDNFDLALQHSSGQCLDCRVELILRDEAADADVGGDLLICEVDATGKWLLFPPVHCSYVSARNGERRGEIIIMIRGAGSNGVEWQELLTLMSEDEQASFEWVQMLGLLPVPPHIMRSQSFLSKHKRRKSVVSSSVDAPPAAVIPGKSRTPSPTEIEVPIGEHIADASKSWAESFTEGLAPMAKTPSSSDQQNGMQENVPIIPSRTSNYVDQVNGLRSLPSQRRVYDPEPPEPIRTPRSFKEALGLSGTSTTIGLKRARAKRLSKHGGGSPSSPSSRSRDGDRGSNGYHTSESEPSVLTKASWCSPSHLQFPSPEPTTDLTCSERSNCAIGPKDNVRPPNHRSLSSVPTMDLPYIPKARQHSPPTTPTYEPEQEPEWPLPESTESLQAASSTIKRRPVSSKSKSEEGGSPPGTPVHRSSSPVHLSSTRTPDLTNPQQKPRRSSSPLKHQYEPSTASESSSDSETSTVEHNASTSVSDSSDDEELEDREAPMPLLPLGAVKRPPSSKSAPWRSTPDGTIKPSESASQAPYKQVPAQPAKASKTIASIFSWSDTGSWQSLHPDECSIVITPGLIEAYKMSAAHSKGVPISSPTPVVDADAFSEMATNLSGQTNEVLGSRPLVALELTPLVPLRRGTALDISIRSPPTSNSQITSGNNIMFRSRNPEECEALYALINHSRINNPTFIALQNARASGSSFGADRRTSTAAGGSRRSWFGGWGRASSYRASSAPTPSIAPSESSVGSMSSAFSALKRFGGRSNGIFNISRSTIMSREGSRANSIYTSSDNSSGSGASSPVPPGMMIAGKDAPIGLSNAKIRLYARESASKWRDMGSARLTIMRPEMGSTTIDGRPSSSGALLLNSEKRIVIHGKTKGEVLLDVQLGEMCFERVARTGIAISVWEDVVGPNGEVGVVGAVGGVGGGRAKVYMLQVYIPPKLSRTQRTIGLTSNLDEERGRSSLYVFHCRKITILGLMIWGYKHIRSLVNYGASDIMHVQLGLQLLPYFIKGNSRLCGM